MATKGVSTQYFEKGIFKSKEGGHLQEEKKRGGEKFLKEVREMKGKKPGYESQGEPN